MLVIFEGNDIKQIINTQSELKHNYVDKINE
jgi:hypothetical protein